jgi:hypothetical protein
VIHNCCYACGSHPLAVKRRHEKTCSDECEAILRSAEELGARGEKKLAQRIIDRWQDLTDNQPPRR